MYPENNGEMVSKLYLGSEWITETDPIYASSGYPKNVNNWKQIQHLDIQRSTYLELYLFRMGDA